MLSQWQLKLDISNTRNVFCVSHLFASIRSKLNYRIIRGQNAWKLTYRDFHCRWFVQVNKCFQCDLIESFDDGIPHLLKETRKPNWHLKIHSTTTNSQLKCFQIEKIEWKVFTNEERSAKSESKVSIRNQTIYQIRCYWSERVGPAHDRCAVMIGPCDSFLAVGYCFLIAVF